MTLLGSAVSDQALSLLVGAADYGTVYNLTDDQGAVVERRYLGDDRFVLLVGRCLHGTGDLEYMDSAYLIPRSLFFQSELVHRLNRTGGLTAGPVLENAKAVWRDVSQENRDGVHLVLNAGGLLDEDWDTLAAMALHNRTGHRIATSVGVSFQLPLLGLPRTVLAAVPYEPLTLSPSASYTWASDGSSTTVSVWEALWNGAAEILDVTWQYVRSAVAFYVEFWTKVAESLVQFGLWVSHVVKEGWAEVQEEVGKAGEAFGQMVDWAVAWIQAQVNAVFDAILGPITDLVGTWASQVEALLADSFAPGPDYAYAGSPSGATDALGRVLFSGSFFTLILSLTLAYQVVQGILTATTAASGGSLGVLAAYATEYVPRYFIQSALALWLTSVAAGTAIITVYYMLRSEGDPFWMEGLGISAIGIADALTKLVIKGSLPALAGRSLIGDAIGLAVALSGLFVALFVPTQLGAWLGLALAIAGLILTMPDDILDRIPINPLRKTEELIAAIALGYAYFNLHDVMGW